MRTQDVDAPSYERLRPCKPQRTPEFPVYPQLTDTLAAAPPPDDPTVRHVLAVCSGYAYADAQTVAMITARLGLEDNRCRMVAEHVDAMLIASSAFLVQSHDGRVVVLCYRGTVPTSLISWLADLDIYQQRVEVNFPRRQRSFDVHGGFYRNVRATRYEVIRALLRALDGRSVHEDGGAVDQPLQALYVCGHSFGGAMAALLAVMLRTQDAYADVAAVLRGVYTYGAPMVGSPQFAAACDGNAFLRDHVLRYVYDNDIVPQVPPRASGDFAHFGCELLYRPSGKDKGWKPSDKPREQLGNVLDVVATPLTILARQVRMTRNIRFGASLYDHFPTGYITTLTPAGVGNEFGGD